MRVAKVVMLAEGARARGEGEMLDATGARAMPRNSVREAAVRSAAPKVRLATSKAYTALGVVTSRTLPSALAAACMTVFTVAEGE